MAVYLDPEQSWPKTRKWPYGHVTHLIADTEEELHRFAQELGLKRGWFQNDSRIPHYDLTHTKRIQAICMGAIEITRQEMVNRMREYQDARNEYRRGSRR